MEQSSQVSISEARFPQDAEAILKLFDAYVEWLDIDLAFQGYSEELASLPGKYSPERGGTLLLARTGATEEAIGCVALRKLQGKPNCAEMKRLYVAPQGRGRGAGRILAEGVIAHARKLRYHEIKLDTLLKMEPARAMYRSLGFEETSPYYETPLDGTIFLSLKL